MKKIRTVQVALVLAFSTGSAFAQWTEKYPIDIKIDTSNVVATWLRANWGKIGEWAAGKLDQLLNDPAVLAKLSAKAIQKLSDLYNDPTKTPDQKAQELIAAIEEDIGSYVSTPQSGMNITVGYAANYDVVRLSWDRQKYRNYCQVETCRCPNGSTVPGAGFFCYYTQIIGGQPYQFSQPATCTYRTDTVDVEAGYDVYRNGKLIARLAEQRKTATGVSLSSSSTFFGFMDLKLTVITPPGAVDPGGRAGPFYDYDPHNNTVGTPLSYTVQATAQQCGPGYTNYFSGGGGNSGTVTVDGDGDGRPDYYPADVYAAKKAEKPPRKTRQPINCQASPGLCS